MDYPGHVIKLDEPDQSLVRAVARRLADLGYHAQSPAGVFDSAFKSLVKLFQAQHVDAFGRALTIDGEVGPLTWSALFGPASTAGAAGPGALAAAALAKARDQIGVMEQPVGSNRGPMGSALWDAQLATATTCMGTSVDWRG